VDALEALLESERAEAMSTAVYTRADEFSPENIFPLIIRLFRLEEQPAPAVAPPEHASA
jgi:hypothetical protein